MKELSQVPRSPPPGPCKPLKALLGRLLENGDELVSFPMKGPTPPLHPASSRALGTLRLFEVVTREWCFCPQSLPCPRPTEWPAESGPVR